jgi:protein-S-isoprenylcysteine O-methyltransferase Ste14
MTHVVLIFFGFAVVHSLTVAQWFKRSCRRALGETFMRAWYRFLYTLVSAATAAVALLLIRRLPDSMLWSAHGALRWALHAVQAAAAVFGALAFEHLDGFEFLGFRQVWRYLQSGAVAGNIEGLTEKGLVTTGVYRVVRHPLYVAGIVFVTANPRVTVNGLTLTVLADLYFLFGMLIEERRFLRIFGDEYRAYMRRVPRMFPRLSWRRSG